MSTNKVNKKGPEGPFCFCDPKIGLAEAEVANGDLTNVVTSVTKAASSVGKLDVAVTCHERYDWFEGGRI